jgi:predicted DNA binding CopG/RHH family protein
MAPTFKSEAEERAFWECARLHRLHRLDSGDFGSKVRLANLKPSTQTISLRLPVGLLERIKVEANRRDMPYQSLIKGWLADQVNRPRV